jgi:catalase
MAEPSTEWRERVTPDEEARFARYAEQLGELQSNETAKRRTPGRALHRKQLLGMRATVEVAADVPAYARHGLFAQANRYDAQIRLSNGAGRHQPDRTPDVRGLALRVLGVAGDGALGRPTTEQHFLFINQAAFSIATADEFAGLVQAAARGNLAVLRYMIGRHGLLGGLGAVRRLAKGLGQPFAGFARAAMHSAAPIACGPYAAKVRLLPDNSAEPAARKTDWAADLIERLAAGPLRWDLQLQFFVDAATTPIEDPTVVWPEAAAPFVTVARVSAPAQDPKVVAAEIEAARLDPWNALAAHRPLGEIMRARKAAYYASTQGRGA